MVIFDQATPNLRRTQYRQSGTQQLFSFLTGAEYHFPSPGLFGVSGWISGCPAQLGLWSQAREEATSTSVTSPGEDMKGMSSDTFVQGDMYNPQEISKVQSPKDMYNLVRNNMELFQGRDRRAMEEDVAKAVREHRRSREEEERKMQQRLSGTQRGGGWWGMDGKIVILRCFGVILM